MTLCSYSLLILAIGKSSVRAWAFNDGGQSIQQGDNLPKTLADLPALSVTGKRDLRFSVRINVDMILVSFIQSSQDVYDTRTVLGPEGVNIKITSRIENEGLQNINEI